MKAVAWLCVYAAYFAVAFCACTPSARNADAEQLAMCLSRPIVAECLAKTVDVRREQRVPALGKCLLLCVDGSDAGAGGAGGMGGLSGAGGAP